MKGKDIKVGKVYAVGRASEGRYAGFDSLWRGVRVRVNAVGVHGRVSSAYGTTKSRKASYAEVVFLNRHGQEITGPHRYRCMVGMDGLMVPETFGRRLQEGERFTYRVPFRDFVEEWAPYVEKREAAREEHLAGEKSAEERLKADMDANRAVRERLVALGVIDTPGVDRFVNDSWHWTRKIDLDRDEVEKLLAIIDRLEAA